MWNRLIRSATNFGFSETSEAFYQSAVDRLEALKYQDGDQ